MRNKNRLHRKRRIRAKIYGTAKCPRVAVFRSNRFLFAQVIDDENGSTICSVHSKSLKVGNNLSDARQIGEELLKKCVKAKIKKVVFDRSGYKYHGKVRAIADSLRAGKIEF